MEWVFLALPLLHCCRGPYLLGRRSFSCFVQGYRSFELWLSRVDDWSGHAVALLRVPQVRSLHVSVARACFRHTWARTALVVQ